MTWQAIRDALHPWAGLLVGLTAYSIAQQVGSSGSFDDCQRFAPLPLIIVALLAIVATAAGAWASWRVVGDKRQGQARHMIAIISTGMAALFVVAMVYPVIAALIIPPCFQ
ncbi:MAG: hypothetical protein V4513_01330 [Pseudomonadota bacterium]